jgi:putative transposase
LYAGSYTYLCELKTRYSNFRFGWNYKIQFFFLYKGKNFAKNFAWQEGFGAFSYSKSQSQNVVNYILNQPQRHKKKTFKQEYLKFLEKFEIEYEDKYLFEFYD